MPTKPYKDMEKGDVQGLGDLAKPFIKVEKVGTDDNTDGAKSGSIAMVLQSTFVTVCGSWGFGSCVSYSAPTESAIREDLNLSLAEYSLFGSILTIGAMFGALASGHVADFIGRKGAMRIAAIFCITGWLAIHFSNGALSLDIGRFFTGFAIGVFSFVNPAYLAEIAPKNLRGGITAFNELMVVSGATVSLLIGNIVTWRTLALIAILPCIFLLVGLFIVPESPRWLAKVGQANEFQLALQRLRGKDADVSQEAKEIRTYIMTLQNLPRARMLDLFQSKYIRLVFIGVGLFICQQFVGINGISFYASETFASASHSSGKLGTIAFACIQIPLTMLEAILIDKFGRRPLMMVSATGTFVGSFLTGLSFFFEARGVFLESVPSLAVAGLLIYIASFCMGIGAVPWVIMSEILPIEIKGIAGSLIVLVDWLCAWTVTYTFNFLMSWSSSGTFFIYSGFSAMTILFVAKFVPETKGKTLEEIQACINPDRRGIQTLE